MEMLYFWSLVSSLLVNAMLSLMLASIEVCFDFFARIIVNPPVY